MLPLTTKGWMVNLMMRRVEPVVAEESHFNTANYGRYRGPRRTYMLHAHQVFPTELHALTHLRDKMTARCLKLASQLRKYEMELASVREAVRLQP